MPRPQHMVQKPKNLKKGLLKLVPYLKPYLVWIILAIFLSIIGALGSLFGPRLLGEVTRECQDFVDGNPMDFEYIGKIGITLICVYTFSAFGNYTASFLLTGVTQKVSYKLRKDISEKINRVPLRYFDSTAYGDLLSRVTNDVDSISQNLNQSLVNTFSSVILLVGVFVMMFTISWQMALICVVSIPLSLFALIIIVKHSQKFFRAQQRTLGDLNAHIEEAYSGHQVIIAYHQEETNYKIFDECNTNLKNSAWKSQFASGLMMPIMGFIGNASYITICFLGGILVVSGLAGVEFIQMFIQYSRMANQPLQTIGQIANVLQSCAAASERVFEFLEEEELSKDRNIAVLPKEEVIGNVCFNNVNFGYYPDKQIIFNFNCDVKKGMKVAIVGPTGAGKTTLVNLLMRFYEVDSGEITIDSIPTQDITRNNLASLFGMVLQDTWLFEGTLRDNLRYGNMQATDEEIMKCLEACHMDHFVNSLPGGLDYVFDETANISAGQKQLLTIARAMIEDSPMLILDEATSSVDTRTEELIQKAMDHLMEGRTSFVIAHRLSTIKNADIILVLKDGNIIEQGNHNELLNKKGFYADLYNSQFATSFEG
ncbi:MAG: ABC transporter ATP-binding protein/permease [Anaeroplasmataceae bacterium]|nr:ABC transporter ATP-binding protein/permease [Anaeroplasmataceae bacterium]